MDKSKLTINLGLKLAVWGIPLGLVLRLIQMDLFFDFDTGFYTGPGAALAWLGLIVPLLMAGAGALCFLRNPAAFTVRERGIARGPGIFAGFSGGVLLVVGLFMLKDYMSMNSSGLYEFESTISGGPHIFMAVMCLVMFALQSLMAFGFCTGRDYMKKAPLLYLPAVLWGAAELIVVYVYYARSSSMVENLYSIFSSVCLLLCLLYVCIALAGVNEPRALQRLTIFACLTAVLAIPYDVSNVALALTAKTYFGELPAVYALGRLSMSMFVFSFALSCYRTGVDKALDGVGARHGG